MSKSEEIDALIRLLDDSDSEVYQHVFQRLSSLGTEVLPLLEDVWGTHENPLLNERLEELIHRIQSDELLKQWKKWVVDPQKDEMEAAYLISCIGFPNLDRMEFRDKIERIRREIWLEMTYQLYAPEQVSIVNQKIFTTQGIHISQKEPSINDFFLSEMLNSKSGNNFSISMLYLIVCSQLDLPVYGLNLPNHFALVFCKSALVDFTDTQELKNQVLFYINPANRGSIFNRNDVREYLHKLKVSEYDKYFIPCSLEETVSLYLKATRKMYQQMKNADKSSQITEILSLLPDFEH